MSWWKEAVFYQIYPRSFNDSDGDGVGDIQGIVEKIDYIDDLGVDAVWLNPVYESPQVDYGYDVSDYRSVHDEYGTMGDLGELLDGLRARCKAHNGPRRLQPTVFAPADREDVWRPSLPASISKTRLATRGGSENSLLTKRGDSPRRAKPSVRQPPRWLR